MWKFEEIKRANGNLTEGPVWDGTGLIFTDGRSNRLLRYDPSTCLLYTSDAADE